jgi:hypothetical protein
MESWRNIKSKRDPCSQSVGLDDNSGSGAGGRRFVISPSISGGVSASGPAWCSEDVICRVEDLSFDWRVVKNLRPRDMMRGKRIDRKTARIARFNDYHQHLFILAAEKHSPASNHWDQA